MADLFRRYRVKAGWVLLIVRNSPELPVVLGNFLGGPPSPGFLEKNGLVPLMDFGEGLILYGRETGR
jgi:hypothetical protein